MTVKNESKGHAEGELRQIPYKKLEDRREELSFRKPIDLTRAALKSLANGIKVNGITTPLTVKKLPNGNFLTIDGHRRKGAVQLNIDDAVEGFTDETLIPAYCLPETTTELECLDRVAAGNLQRLEFEESEKIRLATKMHKLGEPVEDIGKTFGLKETTIRRFVALGLNPKLLAHFEAGNLGLTNATQLAQAAEKVDRQDDLLAALDTWLAESKAEIEKEEADLKAKGQEPLTTSKTQVRLPTEQGQAWVRALKKNEPLERVSSEVHFSGGVVSKDGIDMIFMNGLKVPLTLDAANALCESITGFIENIAAQALEKAELEKARQALQEKAKEKKGAKSGSYRDRLREMLEDDEDDDEEEDEAQGY